MEPSGPLVTNDALACSFNRRFNKKSTQFEPLPGSSSSFFRRSFVIFSSFFRCSASFFRGSFVDLRRSGSFFRRSSSFFVVLSSFSVGSPWFLREGSGTAPRRERQGDCHCARRLGESAIRTPKAIKMRPELWWRRDNQARRLGESARATATAHGA